MLGKGHVRKGDTPPFSLFARFRRLTLAETLLTLFALSLLISWGTARFTDSSLFCGQACHTMRPYHAAWKSSKHHFVPCIDCHHSKEGGNYFSSRARGLYQLAGYLTRPHGYRFAPEFSDATCLGERCHTDRLLERTLVSGQGVPFDHKPHLQEARRGILLRCTTCHVKDVMGLSPTSDVDNCFICHFRKAGDARTTECRLCHPSPPAEVAGVPGRVDHRPIYSRGMDCNRCHSGTVEGKGEVDEDYCQFCHKGPSWVPARFGPGLHRSHVTDHQVPCTLCHKRIHHPRRERESPPIPPAYPPRVDRL